MSRMIEKRRNKISSFLVTLRQMLNNQPPQYITWGVEQNSFKIKNPSRFSEEVLPKYFKHSNLSSFIRQLNIYDFKKVSNEKYPDQYIYSHPFFDKNRPQLMKNIYRKVHHLSNKNSKSNHQDVPYSSNSSQNSTRQEKKKLRQEIEQLQQKLSELQSVNSMVCQQNLQLQAKIPLAKTINAESSKNVYRILMQSYQIQYVKFAEKIQNQLVQQSSLLTELYQRQKSQDAVSSRCIDSCQKRSFDFKTKFDATNYNSTSSGGSNNGHSSRQTENFPQHSSDKFVRKFDKRGQSLITNQNNLKQINFSKIGKEPIKAGVVQMEKAQRENRVFINSRSSQAAFEQRMVNEGPCEEKEYNISEHYSQDCPNRCVIDLRNKRNQQENNMSKMYKAIVLKPTQCKLGSSNFNPTLYST